MPIKVIYENDVPDEIEPALLDGLIDSNKIKKFLRSDGWATVATDAIRGRGRMYEGPERRKTPVDAGPRPCEDVTKLRKLERDIAGLQKLASVGVLAAGLAHDFNNILSVILGSIALARIAPREQIYEHLVDAEKAVIRAKDLTQRLLTFSRAGAPVRKTISTSDLIKDSVALSCSGRKAICEVVMHDDIWSIDADERQIGQAINSIIITADESMPDGGRIFISCENIEIGEDDSRPLRSGKYVKILIRDQGIGIPEENLGKIFGPPCIGAETERCLGLAATYSIIKNHEGHITVESAAEVGTAFTIYLPASSIHVRPRRDMEIPLTSGKGKVLIMDDDELVRKVSRKMLKHIGYEVECVRDGPEAIQMYIKAVKSGKPFDVVIMDLTIPGGMGGKEVIRKLREIDPNVKAIVSSGYTENSVMTDFRDYGFSGIIRKPFNIGELSLQISKVIKGLKLRF